VRMAPESISGYPCPRCSAKRVVRAAISGWWPSPMRCSEAGRLAGPGRKPSRNSERWLRDDAYRSRGGTATVTPPWLLRPRGCMGWRQASTGIGLIGRAHHTDECSSARAMPRPAPGTLPGIYRHHPDARLYRLT
jgi:ribosomal protein L37AE/L43A